MRAPPAAAFHPLDPPLPHRIGPAAERAARDLPLRQLVRRSTRSFDAARLGACGGAFGDRYDRLRALAGRIRQHALDHLDHYLELFVARAEARGTRVHFASDAAEARNLCLSIARAHRSRLCVKSKSMVTEEVRLLPALEEAGIETIETDLGEFIVQLDRDAPSHIVAPMIHKDRASVARAFVRELGSAYTEDPRGLTMIAREHMRAKYRRADLGITGANFLVAETGTLVICTNEGNADLAVSVPPVHVALAGIEKVVPRPLDLAVLLKLLARSATGQDLTVYTTMIHGPRRTAERGGPRELHVILVDNGRTGILREPTRELLRCIRCGACLNACPAYRALGGGHAYGAVYSGPIGATITPLLRGVHNYPDLPQASSLCGACRSACPVAIDIPRYLVALRERIVEERAAPWTARLAHRAWAAVLSSPALYRLATALQRTVLRALASPAGAPGNERWVRRLPRPLCGWTAERDFPAPAAESFRSWWGRTHADGGRR